MAAICVCSGSPLVAVPHHDSHSMVDTRKGRGVCLDDLIRIRGLHNPGALCYCNAVLVSLFASPTFQSLISDETNHMALQLRAVFQQLQHPGPPLSHLAPGPLHDFNIALQPVFPPLARYGEQQDASELMIIMLDVLFQKRSSLFSVIQTVRRPRLDRAVADERCRRSCGVPPIEAIYIPSIDSEVDPQASDHQTHVVHLTIPEGVACFTLDDFFRGQTYSEHVEVDAILGSEKNRAWLTEEKRAALVAAGGSTGKLPSVCVTASARITSPAPALLPVYVSRFSERGDKNTTPCQAPFILSVPVDDGLVQYILRSVIVHGGSSRHHGHYYVYIPDPSALDIHGDPVKWVKASDSEPKRVYSWLHVKEDVEHQGVIYIYDRDS